MLKPVDRGDSFQVLELLMSMTLPLQSITNLIIFSFMANYSQVCRVALPRNRGLMFVTIDGTQRAIVWLHDCGAEPSYIAIILRGQFSEPATKSTQNDDSRWIRIGV
jgi:hypothetical protein